jgi:hypothetical protein
MATKKEKVPKVREWFDKEESETYKALIDHVEHGLTVLKWSVSVHKDFIYTLKRGNPNIPPKTFDGPPDEWTELKQRAMAGLDGLGRAVRPAYALNMLHKLSISYWEIHRQAETIEAIRAMFPDDKKLKTLLKRHDQAMADIHECRLKHVVPLDEE